MLFSLHGFKGKLKQCLVTIFISLHLSSSICSICCNFVLFSYLLLAFLPMYSLTTLFHYLWPIPPRYLVLLPSLAFFPSILSCSAFVLPLSFPFHAPLTPSLTNCTSLHTFEHTPWPHLPPWVSHRRALFLSINWPGLPSVLCAHQ